MTSFPTLPWNFLPFQKGIPEHQLQQLTKTAAVSAGATILVSISLVMAITSQVFLPWLYAWALAQISLSLFLYYSSRDSGRSGKIPANAGEALTRKGLYLALGYAGISGCMWGALALFLPHVPFPLQFVLILSIGGVIAASTATLSAVLAVSYTFILACALPTITTVLLIKGEAHLTLAFTLFVFTVAMLFIALLNYKATFVSLHKLESQFHPLFDGMQDFVVIHDWSKMLYINPAALKALGYTEEEAKTLELAQLVHPDDLDLILVRKQAFDQGDLPPPMEARYITANGASIIGEARGLPIIYHGQVAQAVIVRDITQRKEAETAAINSRKALGRRVSEAISDLEHGENKFRELVETSQDLIWNADTEGYLNYVNPVFKSILGYEPQAWSNNRKSVLSLVLPEDQVKARNYLAEILAGKQRQAELRFNAQDGRIITLSVKATVNRDKHGNAIGIQGTSRDITEQLTLREILKEKESRAQQSEKLASLGTLAGGIAHDFNNILAAIQGNAELALEEIPDDNPASTDVAEIITVTSRAKGVVQRILTFTKPPKDSYETFDLRQLVQEIYDLFHRTSFSSVKFTLDTSPNAVPVLGNPSQIHQVLMNLCTNAYEAAKPSSGEVNLSLTKVIIGSNDLTNNEGLSAGTYAKIQVSDTGPGINHATLERIFDPFFTTKSTESNAGLGLSIVHSIIDAHEGAIRVNPGAMGGSSFEVYLRISEKVPKSAPGPARQKLHRAASILLAEDNADVARSLVRALNNEGYDVTSCDRGQRALSVFKANPTGFDILLTDLNMPHMNGQELAREIHTINPKLPILLQTGIKEQIQEELVGRFGIRAVLGKPFTLTELCNAVAVTLDSRTELP